MVGVVVRMGEAIADDPGHKVQTAGIGIVTETVTETISVTMTETTTETVIGDEIGP